MTTTTKLFSSADGTDLSAQDDTITNYSPDEIAAFVFCGVAGLVIWIVVSVVLMLLQPDTSWRGSYRVLRWTFLLIVPEYTWKGVVWVWEWCQVKRGMWEKRRRQKKKNRKEMREGKRTERDFGVDEGVAMASIIAVAVADGLGRGSPVTSATLATVREIPDEEV